MELRKGHSGFSLLELISALTILGVCLLIAVPSYMSYMARSKVGAALSELSTLKTNYEVALANDDAMPGLNDLGADVMDSSQCEFLLSGQTPAGAATLSCTMLNVPSILTGGILSYTRAEAGGWTCSGNTNVDASMLPTGCVSEPKQ